MPQACADSSNGGLYGGFDYLLWWMKKGGIPALVTHGDPNDTPTGALGQPGTILLLGNQGFGADPFSGGRFTLGYWFDCDRTCGLETSFFFLQQRSTTFGVSSSGGTGTGSLNIPFFNSDGGFEDANQVGLEGTQAGAIAVRLTQRLLGSELNLRLAGPAGDTCRLSWIGGFRFIDLQESLDLQAGASALPLAAGISTGFEDSFATRNRIYGGQIGAEAEFLQNGFSLTVCGKVALGVNDEAVNINGTTVNIDPVNGTVIAPGGLFSGPSNLGNHERTRFVAAPEADLKLGYQIAHNLTATVGYSFLYLSDVVRPGDQIDRVVSFQSNGRPSVLFRSSDFWSQGVNVGLQFRY